MTDPTPEALTPSAASIEPAGQKSALSRRTLLAASGGVAAASFVGLGVRPAAAAAPNGAPAQLPTERLLVLGPHANTARTRGEHPGVLTSGASGPAQIRILPLNRAKFLAGGRFDLRIEAAGVDPATAKVAIAVTGPHGPAPILVGTPERTSSVAGSLEITYSQLAYPGPGTYRIRATVVSSGVRSTAVVTHEVVRTTVRGRKARNVIFFLGDGMGQAAITAARVMSKGITEGKYHGLLEMDRMDHRGNVTTSGADALATDSANSMSAYMTGHKSSVNALGVYEGNSPDPSAHPHVETMAEVLKRAAGMSIGVVTTAEIQDATPAAVLAHTRQRSQYQAIMDQMLQAQRTPDVLMGGGLASLLPKSKPGSKRTDERDLVQEFKVKGFRYAQNRTELAAVMAGRTPDKLLGLFHPGNLNVYLDRQHTKNPAVLGDWNDQPGLVEMTKAALKVLSRKDNGFFLMVEGASIDKQEHPMDGTRAAYDTIEFDQAIGIAKKFAAQHGDTLVVVTADHNHAMSIAGTHVRADGEGRSGNGVYADANYPTYVDSNGDGFPDDPNPDVELFFGWSNHPDHTDDFQHNPVPVQPALLANGVAVPNPAHDPGAPLQQGNLPLDQTNCVHTVEDVLIMAYGPGSARFNAVLDNTEVFFAVADALGLDATKTRGGHSSVVTTTPKATAESVPAGR